MTGVINPATGGAEADKIGLTCAGCHTGSINYKGTSIRFDGGPAMLELRKLELATGLAILYTLKVPGRFNRFADRVLGRDADKAERNKLKAELNDVWDFLKGQIDVTEKTLEEQGPAGHSGRIWPARRAQPDRQPGFLYRLRQEQSAGYEANLHANDAPVSFPPVWTVPWLWWAQYDASIEQPLIRNAGEALGVRALLNLSPDFPPDRLFRSSVALENLVRIEEMLRGGDPFSRTPKGFGGLTSPKWPSHLFPDDPDWKIDPERVAKGRALYAKICAECHLGPVADPAVRRAISRTRVSGPREPALEAGSGRQLGHGRGPEERRRHGNGSRAGQRAGDAAGSGAGFPQDGARGGSRHAMEVHRTCRPIPRPRCRSRSR